MPNSKFNLLFCGVNVEPMNRMKSTLYQSNMKTLLAIGSLMTIVFFVACSKNSNGPDAPIGDSTTTATRLAGWGNSFSQFNLEYDGASKIIRVNYKIGNAPQQVLYNISYSTNQILLAAPLINDASVATSDSVFITLDASNRIANTVRHYFKNAKAETYPQRTYQIEIVKYEYDAAGLLIKQIRNIEDSTITNFGYLETRIARTDDTVIRAHTSGNLSTVNDYRTVLTITRRPSNDISILSRLEFTNTLSYDKAYLNKADFSNQVVLSKLINLSPFYYDSKYTLLPNKLNTHMVEKNESGQIISSPDQVENYDYTYGTNGLVYSKVNQNSTEGKVYYSYK